MKTRDNDQTLSGSLENAIGQAPATPGLTVAWHPDPALIGAQTPISTRDEAEFWVNRFQPSFTSRSGDQSAPLGLQTVSRQPLTIAIDGDGGVSLTPPRSSMKCYVGGHLVHTDVSLPAKQLEHGVVIALGPQVLLIAHYIEAFRQRRVMPELVGVSRAIRHITDLMRSAATTDMTS